MIRIGHDDAYERNNKKDCMHRIKFKDVEGKTSKEKLRNSWRRRTEDKMGLVGFRNRIGSSVNVFSILYRVKFYERLGKANTLT